MPDEAQSPRQVVVVSATKSMGISIILTFLFGPLGMLYSTIPGAIIMAILSVIIGVLTFGFGFLLTWPICIIWGAVATSSYNKTLLADAARHASPPLAQERIAPRSETSDTTFDAGAEQVPRSDSSDIAFDAGAEQKQCPACAEVIRLQALKCKHCGERLDPEAVRTEIERRKTAFDMRKTATLLGPLEAQGDTATGAMPGITGPSPDLAANAATEAEAAATVEESAPEDEGATTPGFGPTTTDVPGSSVPAPRAIEAGIDSASRKPWIVAGAAVVLLALATWAWVHLARPRNAFSRVTQESTPAPVGGSGSGAAIETQPLRGPVEPAPKSYTAPTRTRFLGEWYAVLRSTSPPVPALEQHAYIKIVKRGAAAAELREGWESNGRKYWAQRNNTVRLSPIGDGRLGGRIKSYNFRATHGNEFEYTVTLEAMPNDELQYTVMSGLPSGKEVWKATRAHAGTGSIAAGANAAGNHFIGRWGCLGQTWVDIRYANARYELSWQDSSKPDYGVLTEEQKLKVKAHDGSTYTLTLLNPKEFSQDYGNNNGTNCTK